MHYSTVNIITTKCNTVLAPPLVPNNQHTKSITRTKHCLAASQQKGSTRHLTQHPTERKQHHFNQILNKKTPTLPRKQPRNERGIVKGAMKKRDSANGIRMRNVQ